MSVDHKPNLREERTRIEGAGGVVVWAGTWRVSGVLAVSRAFGDRPLKRFVIPTPDIKEETLTQRGERAWGLCCAWGLEGSRMDFKAGAEVDGCHLVLPLTAVPLLSLTQTPPPRTTHNATDDCLILASDGVWDVLTNQEAVSLVVNIPDAQRAVRRLVEEASRRGSMDNISAVVIKFKL